MPHLDGKYNSFLAKPLYSGKLSALRLVRCPLGAVRAVIAVLIACPGRRRAAIHASKWKDEAGINIVSMIAIGQPIGREQDDLTWLLMSQRALRREPMNVDIPVIVWRLLCKSCLQGSCLR
jgi:hypothetical protein